MKKRLKVAVAVGGGPAPGYRRDIEFLTIAEDEARRILEDDQYEHMKDQVRSLAREVDPTHAKTVSVDDLGDGLYELRDKGGPLGKKNIRVFFVRSTERDALLLVGVIKKENEGQTPPATRKLMLWRGKGFI